MRDWTEIKYFTEAEWGKSPQNVDWRLIQAVDALREAVGTPIHIHCAWDNQGHAANSMHYKGLAVDLHFSEKLTPIQEYRAILSSGIFKGVGWYPHWRPRPGWHLDIRETPTCWYEKEGRYIYGQASLMEVLIK